jgi:hypothetical protein
MSTKSAAISLAGVFFLGSLAAGQSSNPSPSDARTAELIRKLGSSSYPQREQARKELEAIGTPALDALLRARKSTDVETNRRVAELIRRCQEQLLTQHVLAPKQIQLKLTGASVDEGIAELSKLSGYSLQFTGDRLPFADKKITLDTGKTTFWQALDQFCEKAGLSEKIDLTPKAAVLSRTVIRKGRIRQMVDMGVPTRAADPIILTGRATEKSFVSYAGAVKAQLWEVKRDKESDDLILTFVISAEPRLLNTSLEGRPLIAKALDQKKQKLVPLLDEPKRPVESDDEIDIGGLMPFDGTFSRQSQYRRYAHIRLKQGEDSAQVLKELTGSLGMQVDLTNETIAKVDRIMEAAGRSAPGCHGGTLKVDSIRKVGEDIEVQVTMSNLSPNPFGGNMILRGNVAIQFQGAIVLGTNETNTKADLPQLLDARGEKYLIQEFSSQGTILNNGALSQTTTIVYRANPKQAAPSELVLFGTRTHMVAVPFRFEHVVLP